MSDAERRKWDGKYASGAYQPRSAASPFLESWLAELRPPVDGRALDLACGAGRNALAVAAAGYRVDAVDISEVALDMGRAEAERRGLSLDWSARDLDEWVPPAGAYDLITVFRYRNRRLWPRLVDALAPDGWLIVEHHLRTAAPVDGPPSNEFRIEPGEFLDAFGALRVVHYSEASGTEVDERSGDEWTFALARIVACKGDPATSGPALLATP